MVIVPQSIIDIKISDFGLYTMKLMMYYMWLQAVN